MVDLYTQMETSMRVIGEMTKQMVMEFTFILMVHNIKDFGVKINNMDKERRHGQTERCMKVTMCTGKNMVRENLFGRMAPPTLDNSITIILKE